MVSRNKVTSIKFEDHLQYMKKLNKLKIRWIVREIEKGELSIYQIAKQQKISKMHAWRIFKRFKQVKNPILLKPGRHPIPLKYEEIELISKVHEEFPMGATKMEKYLQWKGIPHIPHNRIHTILKTLDKVKVLDKKIRRKKWVRYERRHSNSLWHTDYCELEEKEQLISYLDDASRYIVGYGIFESATTDNALAVFKTSTEQNGIPKQVMTDHGTQFCSDEEKKFRFSETLNSMGVEHIMAKVKRPQSNGKEERWFGTIKKLYHHFGKDIDKAVACYNSMFHLSLDTCPAEAYIQKKRNS
ncbi:MAG: DDE-type integrase/transposase/recombinase [Candidatus Micrarchaeota archaeon]